MLDVAWSVCLLVFLLDTTVSSSRTIEPIEVPRGLGWTQGSILVVVRTTPHKRELLGDFLGRRVAR